ncbi:hypothetical protein ACHAXN_010606 [Cyclotella atomus]
MPRAKGGSIPPPIVYVHPGHGGLISVLNDNDVLSGRGGRINNHPGNIAFRTIVEDYKHEYLDPRTRKLEKAHVAARLVAQVRAMNPPGRFLKEDSDNPGMYLEIGDQKAWKKAGQALREDAPEIRKEIDGDNQDQFAPLPVHPYPPMQAQMPPLPSVSYPPNSAPSRGMDPPEAEGVSGYRQPPLPYYDSRTTAPHSGRGSPHYHTQQPYPGRGYHPQHPHHYAPQPYMHQQYPQGQYPQAPYGTHQPPQRQPQFTGGPRNRFGAPISSSDRRGDFPSLAMSCATDFTMSDVSEFTPVSVTPRHERVIPPPVVPVAQATSLNYMKETTQPLEIAAVRQSSSDKSSLAVSELSVSGLKTSVMNIEPVSPQEAEPARNESNFSMSLGISRNYSFPDLFLSTGDLGFDEEHLAAANEKNDSDPSNGSAKYKKNKSGRLFRQPSAQRQSSLGSNSSIFSIDSLKMGRGSHTVRGRYNTDISGLQDAMSLMSMDQQSIRSEASWLEAAKSMQSISSDMNPWGSHEGNSLRMNERDDGSLRSLSDMSNDLNALDLAELPLLPPIHQVESGLEDSVGFIQRPDP